MDKILKRKELLDKKVEIYIPTIMDKNFGSLKLKKHVFDNLIKQMLREYGKYSKTSEIIYNDDNLTYKIVNKRDTQIYKTTPVLTETSDGCIVNVVEQKKKSVEDFSYVNKYPSIHKRNNMIFSKDGVNMILVTESYSDDKCSYFVVVEFYNKQNISYTAVENAIKYLKSNIF